MATEHRPERQHPPYFHDGSAATLADVVATTISAQLGLTASSSETLSSI
jgi:cytochrome c peroxidase